MKTLVRCAGVLLAMLLAGCPKAPRVESETSHQVVTPSFDEAIKQTSKTGQALVMLVEDSGLGPDDLAARKEFDAAGKKDDSVVRFDLDISVSRSRAEATQFHVLETPVLFCLSSRGIIVSRDEKPITRNLVVQRMDALGPLAHELDEKLTVLEQPLTTNPNDLTAQQTLADFLLSHHNAREAIPHLEVVAHSKSAEPAQRIRVWVQLARAHLWIAEPEKARHEAKDLMKTLGPISAEAVAGGNLVMATQDTTGKRFALAREELTAAIAVAPDGEYAKEAREALAKLPPAEEAK